MVVFFCFCCCCCCCYFVACFYTVVARLNRVSCHCKALFGGWKISVFCSHAFNVNTRIPLSTQWNTKCVCWCFSIVLSSVSSSYVFLYSSSLTVNLISHRQTETIVFGFYSMWYIYETILFSLHFCALHC